MYVCMNEATPIAGWLRESPIIQMDDKNRATPMTMETSIYGTSSIYVFLFYDFPMNFGF